MVIPNSTNITQDTLFSQPHANLYNLINDRSNVPLPSGLPTDHKFVYVREPLKLGRGFVGYPIIIVPQISLKQTEGVVSGTKVKTTYSIDIRIITRDKDSDSSGNPSGAETLNQISDDVVNTLNENNDVLRNYGMKNFEIGSSYDWTDEEGQAVFVREITLIFNQLQTIK